MNWQRIVIYIHVHTKFIFMYRNSSARLNFLQDVSTRPNFQQKRQFHSTMLTVAHYPALQNHKCDSYSLQDDLASSSRVSTPDLAATASKMPRWSWMVSMIDICRLAIFANSLLSSSTACFSSWSVSWSSLLRSLSSKDNFLFKRKRPAIFSKAREKCYLLPLACDSINRPFIRTCAYYHICFG